MRSLVGFFTGLKRLVIRFCLRLFGFGQNQEPIKEKSLEMNATKKEFPPYYDGITKLLEPHAMVQGEMKPLGVTIHYSANRNLKSLHDSLKKAGLGYHLVICRDGTATQFAPFNQKVWHAGKAKWLEFSPNHSHIAVCLLSWGHVKVENGEYVAWTGKKVAASDVALRHGNVSAGQFWWDKATQAQFDALMTFCKWACHAGISPQAICGHDEAAIPKGRKIDPGGVLPGDHG